MTRFALQWILAPLAAYAFALWASSARARPSHAHPAAPAPEASLTIKDAVATWRHAQSETDPIKRLSKSWEACHHMTADDFERAFQEADDTATILSLGEAWAMKDPPSLLEQLQDFHIAVHQSPHHRRLPKLGDPRSHRRLRTRQYLRPPELDTTTKSGHRLPLGKSHTA